MQTCSSSSSCHLALLTNENFSLSALPPEPTADQIKTSHAEITLKSATLPRRKPSGKMEIQVEIKPRVNSHHASVVRLINFIYI